MITTDRRPALYQAFDQAAAIASGARADQLDRPTPCPDFDVATLIDHMVGAAERAVSLGRGDGPGSDNFAPVELADAPARLRRAGEDARRVWSDDARLDAVTVMPWGEEYRGSTLVDMYLAEMAAHAWDLAQATGQLDRLAAPLAPVALEGARAMLKPEYRNLMGPGSPFGSEVTPPADATDWERFAAFMGRAPR